MIIAGMTACGKTHYLLKMLEKEYKNHFDHIFIVCPTFEDNKTYQNWEYLKDPDVFAIACDHVKVEGVLRDIVKFAKKHQQPRNTGRLCRFQRRKKQNQRTRQTCFQWETHRSEHNSHHSTTNFHREAVQDEHIKTCDLLQLPQGRQKRHVRNHLDISKYEQQKILEALRSKKYARLEILTVHPYTHKVVVP